MAEAFLEEQLKRIKEMSEQMSRVRTIFGAVQERTESSDARRSTLSETPAPRRHPSRGSSRRRGR